MHLFLPGGKGKTDVAEKENLRLSAEKTQALDHDDPLLRTG
jgi:hypothetical protein